MADESSQDIGKRHLASLKAFLDSGQLLPVSPKRVGVLNITALVKATSIPRSSFYQNENIEELLDEACTKQKITRQGASFPKVDSVAEQTDRGLPDSQGKSDPRTKAMERRLHRLEQQNAVLVAENFDLRGQVKQLKLQLGRDDMQIESGRRIPPPTGAQ